MGNPQKAKGDKFERELAHHFNDAIFAGHEQVTRAPLSGGGRSFLGGGESDLLGTPGIWVEAKRTERFSPLEAMRQAKAGISSKLNRAEVPVVINRRNRQTTGESLVVMELDDWLPLYEAYMHLRKIYPVLPTK